MNLFINVITIIVNNKLIGLSQWIINLKKCEEDEVVMGRNLISDNWLYHIFDFTTIN